MEPNTFPQSAPQSYTPQQVPSSSSPSAWLYVGLAILVLLVAGLSFLLLNSTKKEAIITDNSAEITHYKPFLKDYNEPLTGLTITAPVDFQFSTTINHYDDTMPLGQPDGISLERTFGDPNKDSWSFSVDIRKADKSFLSKFASTTKITLFGKDAYYEDVNGITKFFLVPMDSYLVSITCQVSKLTILSGPDPQRTWEVAHAWEVEAAEQFAPMCNAMVNSIRLTGSN
jgi:hypothetical protein